MLTELFTFDQSTEFRETNGKHFLSYILLVPKFLKIYRVIIFGDFLLKSEKSAII